MHSFKENIDSSLTTRSHKVKRKKHATQAMATWLLARPPSTFFILLMLLLVVARVDALRVENLKELSKDASSITVEWSVGDEPAVFVHNNDSENDWLGFKIKYFTNRMQFTPVLLSNTQLRKFRLDNLKSNTEYKIQVSAFNRLENEGPASNLLSVRTQESGKTSWPLFSHTHKNEYIYIYSSGIFMG